MIDGFVDETSGLVRLEMLTATVKLFFSRGPEMQKMLGRLLQKAIQETTNPDVRDRALLYYRLLQSSPDEARRVVCASKSVVEEFHEEVDADAKERLVEEFNTLGTVLKMPASKFVLSKVPSRFLGAVRMMPAPLPDGYAPSFDAHDQSPTDQQLYADDPLLGGLPAPVQQSSPAVDLNADLLGDSFSAPSTVPAPAVVTAASPMDDLLGMGDLLGGADPLGSPPPAPAVTEAPFALAIGAKMDGSTFEARWSQIPQVVPQQRQMRPMVSAPLTTTAVEEILKNAGIYVVASGTVPPNALKFFFYAQQLSGPAGLGGEVWFLCELMVVQGGNTQCTLKAQNAQPQSVEAFYRTLWQALAAYVL